VPRIATIIDPHFTKDGFELSYNAEQAAKALEQELHSIIEKSPSEKSTTPMEPTPPVKPRPFKVFPFLNSKLKAKINSPRADAVILTKTTCRKLKRAKKQIRRKTLAAYLPLAHSYGKLAVFVDVSTRL